MPKFVNLTPHEIRVRLSDGSEIAFPPFGQVARVATSLEVTFNEDCGKGINLPFYHQKFGKIEGLPEVFEIETYYIVSSIVLTAMKADYPKWESALKYTIAPETSNPVRDSAGKIVAVKGFVITT